MISFKDVRCDHCRELHIAVEHLGDDAFIPPKLRGKKVCPFCRQGLQLKNPARYLPLLRGLWGELPATHSPMQATGPKYKQVSGEPTPELLRAHLRGEITLAAPLVGADGMARALALDVDTGGEPALQRALASATTRGYSAFAVALTSDEHNGGHLWVRFDQPTDPARLVALGRLLLADAGLPPDTELWPNGPRGDIRLPFGLHVRCGRRGRLLLPDGEVFDLDTPEGLLGGLGAVDRLPLNDTARLPEAPPEPAQPAPRPPTTGAGDDSPIARLNRATPDELAALLVERFGCRIARTLSSGIMLHCGCGHHKHGDRKPSLRVYEGRNGKALVSSYSPGCRWRQRAATDYAAVYIEAHGLTYTDLAPPRPARRGPPAPGDGDRRQSDPEARAHDAQRKRDARRAEALATLADVRDRAAVDPVLVRRPAERKVLHAMLELAGDRGWCRPSKARLVEMTGCPLGSVKRALMELEARGYFASTGDGGGPNDTAVRTFLRGSPCEPEAGRSYVDQVIHESIVESQTLVQLVASEGGRGEPPAWATWEWGDDEHSAAELTTLELGAVEQVVVEAPPSPAPSPAPAAEQAYGDGAFDTRAWLRRCKDAPLPQLPREAAPVVEPAPAPPATVVLGAPLVQRRPRTEPTAPAPRPALVVEAVSYAGGASFDPDQAGTVVLARRAGPVLSREDESRELYAAWCAEHGQGAPLPEPEPEPEQLALLPPGEAEPTGDHLDAVVLAPPAVSTVALDRRALMRLAPPPLPVAPIPQRPRVNVGRGATGNRVL